MYVTMTAVTIGWCGILIRSLIIAGIISIIITDIILMIKNRIIITVAETTAIVPITGKIITRVTVPVKTIIREEIIINRIIIIVPVKTVAEAIRIITLLVIRTGIIQRMTG